MKNKKHSHKKPAKLHGQELEGLLITTFGASAELEDKEGNIIRCHIRKNADPVVTGDKVYWIPEQDGTGTIIGPMARKSLLCRPENAHKLKLIAANIDAIIVVTSPPPIFSEDMVDRFLVAAELLKIQPVILLNKADLLDDVAKKEMAIRLSDYEKIGCVVIYSSIVNRDGLNDLHAFFKNKRCVLVGASGVGKSSIIAALTEQESIRIGEISASSGLGKHTTTTTHMYHLPNGGELIDSPGVREFGLWHIKPEELLQGFSEFKKYSQRCRFRNCKHQTEPDCAIQDAILDNEVSDKRFKSYCKILAGLTARPGK
jgi:ribosome biogenesis GTPase